MFRRRGQKWTTERVRAEIATVEEELRELRRELLLKSNDVTWRSTKRVVEIEDQIVEAKAYLDELRLEIGVGNPVELKRAQVRAGGRMRQTERSRATKGYKERMRNERGIVSCEACGWRPPNPADDGVIHVHHIVQVSQGGTDEDSNLVALCANCHSLADRIARRKNAPTLKPQLIAVLTMRPA
jgi:hypothetical protein